MAQGQIIYNDLDVEGNLSWRDNAIWGTNSAATIKTLTLAGTSPNVGMDIVTAGTGVIRVPTGYEANISSEPRALVNKAYADAHLGGQGLDTTVTSPTITENNKAVIWDNTAGKYKLGTVALGRTFRDGLNDDGTFVSLGGDVTVNVPNVRNTIAGDMYFQANFGAGTSPSGFKASAVSAGVNNATMFSGLASIAMTSSSITVTANFSGAMGYAADYSANYTARSLIDLGYFQSHLVTKSASTLLQGPSGTEDGYVIYWNNSTGKFDLKVGAALPSIANNTILGNVSGVLAGPSALTGAQVNTILPVFTSTLNGSVPASGGGTTKFLRADGTWTSAGSSTTGSFFLRGDGSGGFFNLVSPSDGQLIMKVVGPDFANSGVSSDGTTATFGAVPNFPSQTANKFFASPDGSSGVPSFRTLASGDIPNNAANTTGSAAKWTTGRTLSITGDVSYTSQSFDGTGNVTASGTVTWANGYTTYDARYLQSLSGAWLLASGGTATGANTFTFNTANWATFTGTWTATANNQANITFAGSFTTENVASDNIYGYVFSPNFTRNVGNPASQTAHSVYIKQPTITNNIGTTSSLLVEGGTTQATAALRLGVTGSTGYFTIYQPSSNNVILNVSSTLGISASNIIGGGLAFATSSGTLGFPQITGKQNVNGVSLTLQGNFSGPAATQTSVGVSIAGTFNAQTTGAGKFLSFDSATVNLNANATNVTLYGIDYNPTLTNITGLGTHYGLLIRPTAALSGFGTATPTATLQVNGSGSNITFKTVGAGSTTNYSIRSFQSNGTTEIFSLQDSGSAIFTQPAMSSGFTTAFKLIPGAHTTLTATTEFIDRDFSNATWTWADGTTATQRFNYFRGYTVNKTTTSATFNNIYNLYVDASTAGTGVTFTNNYALGVNGNIFLNAIDSASNTLTLGTSGNSAATQVIQVAGSASDINLQVFSKGQGSITIGANGNVNIAGIGTTGTTIGGSSTSSSNPPDNTFKGTAVSGSTPTLAGRAIVIGGGSGITGVPGGDVIINGGSCSVGNANGGNVYIASGNKIGTGVPGVILFQIVFGTTAFSIDANKNFYGNSGTTGMTNGFIYIPSAAGAPTGTPTGVTGTVPMYYDSTNNNFYVYNGAWKKVLLT